VTEEKKGLSWRAWVIGVAVALLILFVALNSHQVKVNFIVGSAQTPLIFALLIAAALGAVIGYVGPLVRRHRREERRAHEG
jgi:uncharacterized integral membrane protein